MDEREPQDVAEALDDDKLLDDPEDPERLGEPGAVGRLVQSGDEDVAVVDDEADAVAEAYDERDLSAEEAAMHVTTAPPFDSDDGDVDDVD